MMNDNYESYLRHIRNALVFIAVFVASHWLYWIVSAARCEGVFYVDFVTWFLRETVCRPF